MNWEALGAIGEIVSAVAVILTIGYLAIQIRQNTREMRLGTLQNTTERQQQWNAILVGDPELTRIYSTGLTDPDSLNGNDRIRFDGLTTMHLRYWEEVFLQYRRGAVEKEVWEARYAAIKIWVCEPGVRWYWKRRRELFTASFREFLQREIELASASNSSQLDES